MMGLTIHQPWAWLIATGRKVLEVREWSTQYRGKLAIHAGRTLAADDAAALRALGVPVPPDQELARSAILAVVDLVHVRPLIDSPDDARGASVVTLDDDALRSFWGRAEPWTMQAYEEQHAWEVGNVIPLRPTPWRGNRMLWPVPPELLIELRAAFAAVQGSQIPPTP